MMSDWAQKLSSKLIRALLVILFVSALFMTLCLSISYSIYTLLTLWLAPVYAAVCTSLIILLVLCLALRALGNRSKSRKQPDAGATPSLPSLPGTHTDAMALALLAGYMSRSQPAASSKLIITAMNTQSAPQTQQPEQP